MSTVTLGNVGTYSGLIGAILSTGQPALQVWVKYTNAHGGLNCHPVRVVSADDGGDPSTAATESANEVNQDHVVAFVDDMIPLTFNSVNTYVQQHNIPVIGGDSSAPLWFQSPYLFPSGNNYPPNSDLVVKSFAKEGKTKIAYVYCVESPDCGTSFLPSHAKADGVSIVYTSTISLAQPSFTAQCIGAKNAGAQAIMLILDGNGIDRFASNCAAQGYNPTLGAITLALTASVATPQTEGMFIGDNNFPWPDSATPLQAEFQQAVKQYNPTMLLSGATATAWTAGEIVVAASKDLGANPTSQQFFQGLWSIKNNDIGGLTTPITYNQNAAATPTNCSFVLTIQNGKFVDPNNGKYVC